MDGRPKRIKKFAFTSVCVYNRLRVDGALRDAPFLTLLLGPYVFVSHAQESLLKRGFVRFQETGNQLVTNVCLKAKAELDKIYGCWLAKIILIHRTGIHYLEDISSS